MWRSVSAETDRFEQARDPSHSRLLPDQDIRFLLDANDLEVLTNEIKGLGLSLKLEKQKEASATQTQV